MVKPSVYYKALSLNGKFLVMTLAGLMIHMNLAEALANNLKKIVFI